MRAVASLLGICAVAFAAGQVMRISYRTLQDGQDEAFLAKDFKVFTTQKALQTKLNTLKAKLKAADMKIDWKKEKVVAISAGQIPTSGYSIAIQHVERDANGLTTINAILVKPRPELRVQPVLTYPFIFIAIPKATGKLALHWVD